MPIERYCPECAHVLREDETTCPDHPQASIESHEWDDSDIPPIGYTCDFCSKDLEESEVDTHTC